jgi:acetyl-CoA carboxylase carboxyltransferase component
VNSDEEVLAKIDQIKQGGPERYRQRAKAEGRLLVRERLARLLDPGFGFEDGLFADATDEGNAADG